jgi:hypothetical protein
VPIARLLHGPTGVGERLSRQLARRVQVELLAQHGSPGEQLQSRMRKLIEALAEELERLLRGLGVCHPLGVDLPPVARSQQGACLD